MRTDCLFHRKNLIPLRLQPRRPISVYFVKRLTDRLKLHIEGGERVDHLATKSIEYLFVYFHPGSISSGRFAFCARINPEGDSMNKANVAILVIAAAVLLAVGSAQTNRTTAPTGPAGRYQLLYGEHLYVSTKSGNSTEDKVILRIDTATGKTSVWFDGEAKDGTMASWWSPISEYSEAQK